MSRLPHAGQAVAAWRKDRAWLSFSCSRRRAFDLVEFLGQRRTQPSKGAVFFDRRSGTVELPINLKTATPLGLTIPQSQLLRADEVIE